MPLDMLTVRRKTGKREFGTKRIFHDVDSFHPGTDIPCAINEAGLLHLGFKWIGAQDESGIRRWSRGGKLPPKADNFWSWVENAAKKAKSKTLVIFDVAWWRRETFIVVRGIAGSYRGIW